MYKCFSLFICVFYLYVKCCRRSVYVCLFIYLFILCLFVGWQRKSVFILCLFVVYLFVCCLFLCLFLYLFVCLFVCRVSEEECDEDFLFSFMFRYRQLLFVFFKFCLAILIFLGIENQDCGNQVSRFRCKMFGVKIGEQIRVLDSWYENFKLRIFKIYFVFMKFRFIFY